MKKFINKFYFASVCFLSFLSNVFAGSKTDAIVKVDPPAMVVCENNLLPTVVKEFTVGSMYTVGQKRSQEGKKEDSLSLEDLKNELKIELNLTDDEFTKIEASQKLKAISDSGLLGEAVRIGMLSIGIDSNHLESGLAFLKEYGMPREQVELLIERVVRVLQEKNLPAVRAENLKKIDAVRNEYRLTIQSYQTLSEIVNAEDAAGQANLRFGILGLLTSGSKTFVDAVMNAGFWRMRRNKKEAVELVNATSIQKIFLDNLEKTNAWGSLRESFKGDVYDHVNNEFARINKLKLK